MAGDPEELRQLVRERFDELVDRFSVYASSSAPLCLRDPLVAALH